MAEVYLAEQERLKRRVAVKILKPELAGDRTYLQRFELEAQAAASLVHANIVQIYEVGCVDRSALHRPGVRARAEPAGIHRPRHGPPDLPHALSIMRQVAAALAKAAEQGVVHRDIKPENIMLTASGEVKVADFGLARLTREGDANDLTQSRHHPGHAAVHEPRAGRGQAARPAQRHLLVRRDLLPHAGRRAAVSRAKRPWAWPCNTSRRGRSRWSRCGPTCRRRCAASCTRCWPKDPAQRFAIGPRFAARVAPRADRAFRRRLAGRPARLGIAGRRKSRPIPRIAVTRQLDGLMKTMAAARPSRRPPGMVGGGPGRGLCAGRRGRLVAASCRRRCWPTPRPPPRPSPNSQRLASVVSAPARSAPKPPGKASSTTSPTRSTSTLRAEQQLALIYLHEHNYRPGDGDLRQAGQSGRRRVGIEGVRPGRQMRRS